LAAAAAITLTACSGSAKPSHLSADATTSTTADATTTTSTAEAPTTSTTAAPTTTTTARPTTTTAKPTTTTTAPAHAFRLTPTSGGQNTTTHSVGSGCTGANAGVTESIYDPSGQSIDGSGEAARPDGSWDLAIPFTATPGHGPGKYKFVAICFDAVRNVQYFTYAPQYFTFTG